MEAQVELESHNHCNRRREGRASTLHQDLHHHNRHHCSNGHNSRGNEGHEEDFSGTVVRVVMGAVLEETGAKKIALARRNQCSRYQVRKR